MPIKPTYGSYGALIGIISGILVMLIILPMKMSIDNFMNLRLPGEVRTFLTLSTGGDSKPVQISEFMTQDAIESFDYEVARAQQQCSQQGLMYTGTVINCDVYVPPETLQSSNG